MLYNYCNTLRWKLDFGYLLGHVVPGAEGELHRGDTAYTSAHSLYTALRDSVGEAQKRPLVGLERAELYWEMLRDRGLTMAPLQ